MSIKDTVQSMEQNLKAYYDALEEKGGTVPEERNMENLAGTASVGGDGDMPTSYRLVGDFWTVDQNYLPIQSSSYPSTNFEMYSTLYGKQSSNSSFQVKWFTRVSGGSEYGTLAGFYSVPCSYLHELFMDFSKDTLPNDNKIRYFLAQNSSTSAATFTELKKVDIRGLTSIGENFGWHDLNNDTVVTFDNSLQKIGTSFLAESNYAKPFSIPGSVTSVGSNFMYNCRNFVGPLYVPEGCQPPTDNNSLATDSAQAKMYVNGIVLTGPGAAAWKAALPDRTTSPYRKLIVATTLLDFKNSLDAGTAYTEFPVGSEIYDTYNGQSNPLIVVQYLDNTNNNEYGGAVGAIMMRKYAEPTGIVFDDTSNSYQSSSIKSFLSTGYYDNCSDELKTVVSDITIPVMDLDGSTTYLPQNKWFVMGAIEVCAFDELQGGSSRVEGINWEYWKNKIGSSGSTAANAGRIITDRDGNACYVWTRTKFTAAGGHEVYGVMNTGAISQNFTVTTTNPAISVLPACFIAKD